MVIQAMVSMAVFTPPVLAPLAAPEIGLSPSAAGLSTALIYGAAAIAALVSGGFIARLGPMRTSQLCLLLVAIGISCMALAHPLAAAFGAVLIGLGYGPVTPSSSAILNERTPPHLRAFIFSVKQTGVPIGGGLAGALVPLLIVGWAGRRLMGLDYMSLCGLLAGSMTDPPALGFANSIAASNAPSIAYAAVYPTVMILRILSAQLLVLFFS